MRECVSRKEEVRGETVRACVSHRDVRRRLQVDRRKARAVGVHGALGDDEIGLRLIAEHLRQRREARAQRHDLERAAVQLARVHCLEEAERLPQVDRLIHKGDGNVVLEVRAEAVEQGRLADCACVARARSARESEREAHVRGDIIYVNVWSRQHTANVALDGHEKARTRPWLVVRYAR